MSPSPKSRSSWLPVYLAGGALLAVLAAAAAWLLIGGPGEKWDVERELAEHRRAALYYIRDDQIDKARRILEPLIERYPDDAEARVLMAQVHMAAGETAEAYEQITQSLELDSTQDEVHFLAGQFTDRMREYERARHHYARAAAQAPSDPRYRLYLGQVLVKMNDLDEAQMQLLRARALDADVPQVYAVLAEVSARRGNLDMAIDQTNKLLDLLGTDDRDQRMVYTLLKAQYLRRNNEPEAALGVIDALGPAAAEDPRVAEHAAFSLQMLGDQHAAAERWERVFRADSTNARAAAEAGLCFLRADEPVAARRYLGLARRVDPDEPRIEALEAALREAGEAR